MKSKLLLIGFALGATIAMAEPAANYYSSINGKKGDNIRLALSSIISSHTNVGYDGLFNVYAKADMREDGKTLWDMYSDCEFTINSTSGSNATVCGCYNREHSLPKSWWGGGKAAQYSDAYHVVPTDCRVNNQRSAYPFGECEGGTRLSNKARGKLGSSTFSGYSGTVFEPDDEYKGDFARHYFYMLTAYPNVDFTSGGGGAIFAGKGKLTAYGLALLLKWHRLDPVSPKELKRNDAVSSFQNNRNPYIDYPCLVEYIWGSKQNETIDIATLVCAYSADYASSDMTGCYSAPTAPTILTPKSGDIINVGSASLNKTASTTINVTAALLTGPVALNISGNNAPYFSLSTNTIPAATANAGTDIAVNYTPASLGNHSATLTLTSPGAKDISITLKGSCIANLISPADNIQISNNNVGMQMPFNIHIEGTNLSNNITLTIDGNMFQLSRQTVSPEEADNGIDITACYTPASIGTHNATLSIASPDFTTRTIKITGRCVFEVLPATVITYSSAQLNWTNAGTANYTIDVYQKSISGTEEQLILSDDCANTKGTKGDGYQQEEKEALRLGSSSKTGSLSFPGLDLSAGGRIEFEAMSYNNDNSQLQVLIGSTTLAKQQLSTDFQTYTVEVPANAAYKNTTVTFTTLEKSKRAYLKTVKIYTGGEQTDNVSLPGYPLQVTNTQSFIVTGLQALTEYYFTIQPEGQNVSEENIFLTDNSNTAALSSDIYEGVTHIITDHGVQLTRIPVGSRIRIYDALGRLLNSHTNTQNEEHINLPQGFFLIKINGQTIKILRN